MLGAIVRRYGVTGAAEIMGQAGLTVKTWIKGGVRTFAVRRVIWLHYVLLFEPGTIETVFDLATWGRFRVVKRRCRKVRSLALPA